MTKASFSRRSRRAGRRLALAAAGFATLAAPEALAQSCSYTLSNGVYNCSIPAGNYSQPFQGNLTSSTPLTFLNSGSFGVITSQGSTFLGALQGVVSGANGADSSSDTAGSAMAGGNLNFTNNGAVTHGISVVLGQINVANTVYAGAIGGSGGNYTGDNAKHDAGNAASSGSANAINTATITVNNATGTTGTPTTIISGAALLADSVAGNGGNVTTIGPDHNGNPQYHSANGTAGAAASSASMTNSGQVSVALNGPLVSAGYWGVAARSLGGRGGTGNDGTAGGNAGGASVSNSANVSVSMVWGAPVTNTGSFPATPGAFAVHARSQGGDGNMSVNSGNDGGAGGTAGLASVTVGNAGTPLTLTLATSNPYNLATTPLSAVVGAISLGGVGGAGYDKSIGGKGGGPGAVSVTVQDSVRIIAMGDRTLGVLALSQGGVGGNSGVGQDNSTAGNGGGAAFTNNNQPVTLGLTNAVISTTGIASAGVMAAALGGGGGTGLTYTEALDPDAHGGTAGGGGNTSTVQVTITGGSITTTGAQSPGVVALTQGGLGGRGGDVNALGGYSGDGGTGGQAAPVTLTISGGTVITTSGAPSSTNTNPSFGVYAASLGGHGGQGGDLNVDSGGGKGNGGYGGAGYDVTVSIASGSSISTSGAGAAAIGAFSLGGAGGAASPDSTAGFVSTNGDGGAGGASGNVSVTNGANLTTTGTAAHGIIAQSVSGLGGNGGDGAGVLYGPGGNAGSSGVTGSVTVNNSGSISTSGSSAFGIQAQSIGGGSGAGGTDIGAFVSIGGSAPAASNGGAASVTHSGGIVTRGDYALGILTQSIGGGGGNAGDTSGVFGSVGGSGGGGGAGGTAAATINGGSIATSGRLAHGLVVQSVGGGGGNAGDAQSSGTVLTLAIGGTAGDGGAASPVTVNATGGSIGTQGSNAIGLVAQSIGGGGGTGGSAYTLTGGTAFSAAVAIGGSGGSGGNGGNVTLNLAGLNISTGQAMAAYTNTNPVDAYGIVMQSLGGGGGVGGSASAKALSVGIPLPGTDGSTYSGSVAVGIGGSGSTAGTAGTVSLTMNGGGSVTTQGQGSHAILLQSIGGGGGAGGDSSAMATTISYGRATTAAETDGFSSEISVAIGGKATAGAAGGAVTANIDQTNIMTLGDYANGLVAHSVGGGGGNGGVGSSSTLAFGSTRNLQLALGLGGSAGGGGAGGAVSVTIEPQAVIQTYGASALGMVAQSIGGGGGLAQGSTLNLGGAVALGNGTTVTPSANYTITVGATGGKGGDGGGITTVMQGQVRTGGSDAPGVALQSLGGGGGIGGSAGAEASADNPISIATKLRTAISDYVESNVPVGFSAVVSIGGRGGVAGNGGGITYSQAGSITTQGDWSHGLVAQSIGGGGGMGGVAAAGSSEFGFSTNVALGASGGAGGNGGTISLTFGAGSAISTGLATSSGTTGYAAFGVLAQSIGGGGGTGADGSTSSVLNLNLGATGSGNGGSGGNGGSVTVNGTANIVTRGDVGVGMVLQSIGAGGGVGGTGNYASAGIGQFTATTGLLVGAGNGAAGTSAGVSINNAVLNIQTSGANAFGVLAQAIGGGGGFAFSPNLTTASVNRVGGGIGTVTPINNGGTVMVTLSGGSITTSGAGAHGFVAQSIGGGGGIAGLPTSGGFLTPIGLGDVPSGSTPGGAGETVSISSAARITTTGDFAYGILAQSIGGGGGMLASGAQVFAGTTNSGAGAVPPDSQGGSVTVTVSAPVTVSGKNSVGIFAQSVGSTGASAVFVNVGAAVQGGSGGGGYGVWVDSVNANSAVNVQAGGAVSALSGNAIQMTAGNVNNSGTVTGSYALSPGSSFGNAGRLNAGPSLTAGLLVNAGDILVGALAPFGVSRVSGGLVQQAPGRLLINADFGNRQAAMLTVQGDATLAGRVRPLISSVLPDIALPFMTVRGNITGAIEAENSTLFTYRSDRKGGAFTVTATAADFTPPGYALARAEAAMAGHMQAAWDLGGNLALGPLFAVLGNTADAGGVGAYRAALRQLAPDSGMAPGARIAANAQAFANAALSCPEFQGSSAMLIEGACAWARLTGRTASQASSDGVSSFRLNSMLYQIGGQWALGGGWFLGGSLAYENTRLSGGEGLRGGRGESGHGAITAKYQAGPWLFSAALHGGAGEFNGTRTITLPGFSSIARGSPTLSHVGGLVRGTYTLGREEFYLRPSLTLGVVQARSSGYVESGAGALNLDVSSAAATVAALTPALELGGRVNLENGMVLRLFGAAGVSFLSQGEWSQQARLVSAPGGAGRFQATLRTDQTVARVTAGAQLFASRRIEMRLQYEGEYSASLTGHGGSLVFAYRF